MVSFFFFKYWELVILVLLFVLHAGERTYNTDSDQVQTAENHGYICRCYQGVETEATTAIQTGHDRSRVKGH